MAVITITRGVQSGGRELARRLSERLDYRCVSREVIADCAKKYNIMESDLYSKLMEAPSLWQRLSKEHRRYLVYIQCALIDAARQDNVIYHGYAGHLFLEGVRHALKIRLNAPFEARVRAEMAEYSKEREEAETYIKRADEERNRWVKFLYDREWHDPMLYDLSINMQNITVDIICDMVERAVASPEYKTTEASVKELTDLSTECEIRAAIASDDRLWSEDVSVSVNGSAVTLRGSVRDAGVRDAIVAVASQVKSVTDCESYMHLSTDPLKGDAFKNR